MRTTCCCFMYSLSVHECHGNPGPGLVRCSFSLHAAAASLFVKGCLGSFAALWVDPCPTVALP
ncbi:unnamed protein product, partial [Bubo scandiacus]